MKNEIADAIRNKRCLKIFYAPGERLVEPHTLGLGKDSQILLRAYQIAGASSSGEPEHWKLLRVDRIGNIEPGTGSSSAPRPGYKKNDPVMKGGIIAEL
jgi:predicted DNA-binding transcriptional regulator YafY